MKNQRNLEGIAKMSKLMVVRYLHFSIVSISQLIDSVFFNVFV
jgi:hypothetical protein